MITNSAKVDILLSVKILLIYLNVFSVKKNAAGHVCISQLYSYSKWLNLALLCSCMRKSHHEQNVKPHIYFFFNLLRTVLVIFGQRQASSKDVSILILKINVRHGRTFIQLHKLS